MNELLIDFCIMNCFYQVRWEDFILPTIYLTLNKDLQLHTIDVFGIFPLSSYRGNRVLFEKIVW